MDAGGAAGLRAYYRHLGIIQGDDEQRLWDVLASMPPPAVVRINVTKDTAKATRERLRQAKGWRCVPWYPHASVWMCSGDVFVDEDNKEMKEWLDAASLAYVLRYQEQASLLPPLLLQLRCQTQLSVLDLCASPGSKTLEIVELLRGSVQEGEEEGEVEGREGRDLDLLVANDLTAKRARKLASYLQRCSAPGLIVANGDAANFPVTFVGADRKAAKTEEEKDEDAHDKKEEERDIEEETGVGREGKDERAEQFLFDRVLADVPCSGDGTFRKNPAVLQTWRSAFARGLHRKQQRILLRGLLLLAPGGLLVYSTCSMNPIENEAVVGSVLEKYGEQLELLDGVKTLSGMAEEPLTVRQGVTGWEVAVEDGNSFRWYETWEEVEEEKRVSNGGDVAKSMFPPSLPVACLLRNCVRVSPLDVDTSGFFVAVFRKKTHVPIVPDLAVRVPKEMTWRGRNERNRWREMGAGEEASRDICEFYGLVLPGNSHLLEERNVHGNWAAVTVATDASLRLMRAAFQGKKKPFPLLTVGVTILKKMKSGFVEHCSCRWRATQEGATLLASYATKRKLVFSDDAFAQLRENKSMEVSEMRQWAEKGQLCGLDTCEEMVGPVLVAGSRLAWLPAVITGKQMLLFATQALML